MEVLQQMPLGISEAEMRHQRNTIASIVNRIPDSAEVSLEGPPIYLNERWGFPHTLGYNFFLRSVMDLFLERGTRPAHPVLVDDYTVPPLISQEEYLQRIEPPVDRVLNESSFVPAAEGLLEEIGRKGVKRSDGRAVSLVTKSGRVPCAILDAAFQGIKEADFNIVIHPIEFLREQEEMRAVIIAAKDRLPASFVNIFFKGRNINRVYFTSPEGSTERARLL